MSIKPAALRKGDLIGIMAPSSVIDKGELDNGLRFLGERGFKTFVHPQTYARDRSSAGTGDEKAAALHGLFARKDIKAVFAANGGNHALYLLMDKVDFKIVRKNPKIFMGFSDTTALLNAFNARANLTTFHGPLVKWMPTIENIDITFSLLAGQKVSYPLDGVKIWRKGAAEGPLVGGNLSLVNYMTGTKYLPKMDGAILFLEDVGEETSNLDRLFWRLRAMGVFDKISGLVLGQFTKLKDTGRRPYGFDLDDIIERHIGDLKIPVISNAPFGHENLLAAMPIGCPARLSVRGGKATLGLSEPAVQL